METSHKFSLSFRNSKIESKVRSKIKSKTRSINKIKMRNQNKLKPYCLLKRNLKWLKIVR